MKRLLAMSAAFALLAAPAAVLAQTSTTSPSTGSSATMQGKMSEAQLKQKLEQQGYSDIKLHRETSTAESGSSTASTSGPEYTGTAMKDGKSVNIDVNSQGEVTEK